MVKRFFQMKTRSPWQRERNRPFLEYLEDRTLPSIVTFDPRNYLGGYEINGVTGRMTGINGVDLPADVYTMCFLQGEPAFTFSVDDAGNVASNDPVAAEGSGSTLTFNNVTINIDPGAFPGMYQVAGVWHYGTRDPQVVVPHGTYFVDIANYEVCRFTVVDAQGTVTSNNAGTSYGDGNTLYFRNVDVTYDPGAYPGLYNPAWGVFLQGAGTPQTVALVPNMTYFMAIANQEVCHYSVDGDGHVTSSDNPAAVTATGNTLQFHTVPVNFDPGDYSGWYYPAWGVGLNNGMPSQTVPLLPNVTYVGTVGNWGWFSFFVNTDGKVTSNNPGVASGSDSTLYFNNVFITIDPETYGDWYYVSGGIGLGGKSTVPLIPGPYLLGDATGTNLGQFSVSSEQVTPSTIPATIGGQDYVFHLYLAQPTVTVISSADPSVFGQSVTFTAAVTALNGTPRGTVTFFDGTAPLGTVPLSTGTATLTTADLAVGQHGITARYNFQGLFETSTSAPLTQWVVSPLVVTNTDDSGNGSLRQAITEANANPGPDMIFFNIPDSGTHTILL
jgi:hypothetical protein